MAADAVLDSAGVALAVGNTVNLTGTITAINPLDNRYGDVEVSLSHPVAGIPGRKPAMNLSDVAEVGGRLKIKALASMLTKV